MEAGQAARGICVTEGRRLEVERVVGDLCDDPSGSVGFRAAEDARDVHHVAGDKSVGDGSDADQAAAVVGGSGDRLVRSRPTLTLLLLLRVVVGQLLPGLGWIRRGAEALFGDVEVDLSLTGEGLLLATEIGLVTDGRHLVARYRAH